MAGQLDSLLKKVAKQVVSDLGSSLDTTITFIKKGQLQYNVATGQQVSVDTTFTDIKVPIEFIRGEEVEGQEEREAKLYITPDLIGDNQITINDKIKLTFNGKERTAQIFDIDTKKGGQIYLFTVLVRF